MATSILQSIGRAITGTSAPASAQESSESGQNTQTVQTVYDNAGNPIEAKAESRESGAQPQSQPEPTIEELLFSEENQNQSQNQPQNQAQNQPQNQSQNQAQSKELSELAPGLSTQQLLQKLGEVNYLQTIPEETLSSALGGDTKAFGQVLSTVAQLSAAIAVHQSVTANNSILDSRLKEFDSTLTNKIGDSRYSEILSDPKFSNPFIRPLAENLIGRLRARDPSITPDQIKSTLPQLIEYSMKQFNQSNQSNQSAQSNQSSQSLPKSNNPRVRPTEVNLDEIFS